MRNEGVVNISYFKSRSAESALGNVLTCHSFKSHNCTCSSTGQERESKEIYTRTVQPQCFTVVKLKLLQQDFKHTFWGLYFSSPLVSETGYFQAVFPLS